MIRDEETAEARCEYVKIPTLKADTHVVILEQMLATGGSIDLAVNVLLKRGIHPKNIHCVALIGAPEGIQYLHEKYPDMNIILGSLDEKLNSKKYIVPGLGDGGDRAFNSANNPTKG
eukprot:CAMPEP_0117430406 /NCGR_PEP_ID=MMETSP0758-20121206/9950_1 /TAXON_ID=63605 /ORGANISM="Percolomonas cosmopolitus, Strain AE-1 (ATCC 50343)" /LENGTH=116 /DNA_ID=CAMNT_0005218403 /DNA_START=313 /DNA_END=659 /DNA_ORIENTATION=+